eukprot:scaffold28477_cov112-Isochrysis_galbana.AAC.2
MGLASAEAHDTLSSSTPGAAPTNHSNSVSSHAQQPVRSSRVTRPRRGSPCCAGGSKSTADAEKVPRGRANCDTADRASAGRRFCRPELSSPRRCTSFRCEKRSRAVTARRATAVPESE